MHERGGGGAAAARTGRLERLGFGIWKASFLCRLGSLAIVAGESAYHKPEFMTGRVMQNAGVAQAVDQYRLFYCHMSLGHRLVRTQGNRVSGYKGTVRQ
jgi:hypothetical protein